MDKKNIQDVVKSALSTPSSTSSPIQARISLDTLSVISIFGIAVFAIAAITLVALQA